MRQSLTGGLGTLLALMVTIAACGTSGSRPAAQASPPPASSGGSPVGASPGAQQYPRVSMKTAYSAVSVAQSPVWYAKDAGIFEKYGIDADLSYIATSSTMVPAIMAGDVPIAAGAEEAVISAGLGGSDVVIIASGPNRLLFSIYGTPDLNTLADLKGKRLGVTRFGSATDFAARYTLSHNNLRPNDDVTILQMGGVPEILAGIKAGGIDAGVLSPPNTFLAKDAGLHEIVDISKQDLVFYQGPIIAKRSWVNEHHDLAVRYVKAYIESIAAMQRNQAQAREIVGKYTNESNTSIIDQSLAAVYPLLPLDQTPQLEAIKVGLEQAADSNPSATSADPSQFVDTSVMQEIVSSGFLKTLGQ